MIKTIIGVGGIVLFLCSIFIYFHLKKSAELASSLDDEKTAYGSIGEGPLPCTWAAQTPERVMAENKTQAVVVEATNIIDEDCESTLSLRAPGFDMAPPKEEQKINLTAGGRGSLSWILTPRKVGTFDITVSDILNTKIFGITVTNVFGLSAVQAKFASIIGTLFGPMLTVPWWWDRLRGRKQKVEIGRDEKQKDNYSNQ